MRKIFDRIDDTLIDTVFQPMVDWAARRLVLDSFRLARFCSNVTALMWILSQAGDMAAAVRSGWVGLQVFQATLLLLGLGSIMVLHMLFQREPGAGTANPLRHGMYVHRFCLLLGLAGSLYKAAIGLGSVALLAVAVFAASAAYVGACSNPPPKRRGSEWGHRIAALPR